MGLLSFLSGNRTPFDPVAAAGRVEALQSALPPGTKINLLEPDRDLRRLVYMIELVGDRRLASQMLGTAAAIVASTEERWDLDLSVHDTADEESTYSSFALPDVQVEWVDVLGRAHDEMYAIAPEQTIVLDADGGDFTISDLPRGKALAIATAAVRWWEGILRDTAGRWSDSTLSVEAGPVGDGVSSEVIYSATVERDPDPMGYNKTATGSKRVTDEEWSQRVFAAWNQNLPAFEAMLRLPVPAGHEAEISFTATKLKPRLSVRSHESYSDEDKAVAKELVATIRSQIPDSKLKVE
ncbi:hypothetical protein GEV29_04120 [Aeromicrobium sp. SMF47]|uniref:hypothetical protein n=1 Tax=Aeromicrobium yanjiei TaxID=2662028 RepID=UPI00129E8B11|nr:hypothetical protein [Aeromicrobium yanjiei]MRJ75711.1 hypothetical protein [Aeromicrobium yanjiei]